MYVENRKSWISDKTQKLGLAIKIKVTLEALGAFTDGDIRIGDN